MNLFVLILLSLFSVAPEEEILSEDRIWDGGGGDNLWMNPLNWSNDLLPELDADVLIQTDVTVIYDNPSYTVESISILNNAHLIIAEGSYLHTTKGAAGGSDGFRLTGGFTSDSIARLTVYGTLDITMAFAAGDGMDINKNAEVLVAEGGLLSISNPSQNGLEISDKLTNEGTITITNTGESGIRGRSVVDGGGEIINTATGEIIISEVTEMGIWLGSNAPITNNGSIKVFGTGEEAFDGDGHELFNFGIFEAEGLITAQDFIVENDSEVKVGAPIGKLILDNELDFSNSTLTFTLEGDEPVTEYSQLEQNQGSFDFSNASLNVAGSYIPQTNDVFVIVLLGVGQSVVGGFVGLPEGATFSHNGRVLKISYVGGDGNDVTLTTQSAITDNDMDGFFSDVDCDDDDSAINPDAIEIINNDVDENCDGIVEVIDIDDDGFNSDEDCDDTNADINPDATEIPNNNIDEDCDGTA
ncbi:MAG: putative metal-binding motif-containing protein, partial [Saprospiraceae bacterium]